MGSDSCLKRERLGSKPKPEASGEFSNTHIFKVLIAAKDDTSSPVETLIFQNKLLTILSGYFKCLSTLIFTGAI